MATEKINLPHSISEFLGRVEKSFGFKNEIKWSSAIPITLYHIVALYWCYQYAFPAKWQTILFAVYMFFVSGYGVTGGAHRLFSHKAFKVKLPLKIITLMAFAAAGQNSLYDWVRDHRVHHKNSDTEADPHNVNRGLFFSHIGWLMMKKNKEVIRAGKLVDMSDIESDPIIRLFNRYFIYWKLLFCYILPVMAGVWLWNEDLKCAIAWQCFIRFLCTLHVELTVNSLAHYFGYKPYNKTIMPAENFLVSFLTFGEGWHNYHHAFPFDYKAAKGNDIFNFTCNTIHFFAWLGWAYDLKVATPEMINSIANRIGDGSHVPVAVKDKKL